MKVMIAIPVYKHRYQDMLKYAVNFKKEYNIFIVAQNNDPNLDEYNQYCVQPNINVLNTNSTSIFGKREAILEYAKENNYDYCFQIDDDLEPKHHFIDNNLRTNTGRSLKVQTNDDFNLEVDEILEKAIQYDGAITGCVIRCMMGFVKDATKVTLNESGISNLVCLDIKKLKDADIHYNTSGELNEDIDICYQALIKGLNVVKIWGLGWQQIQRNWSSGNNSTVSNSQDKVLYLAIGTALKYKLFAHIREKDKTNFIRVNHQFKKYAIPGYKPEPLPRELEILYEKRDIQGIKDYIKNNKITKKSAKEIDYDRALF